MARLQAEGILTAGLSRRGGCADDACDVRSLDGLNAVFDRRRPSHVFHLAGSRERGADPARLSESLSHNLSGTVNVLLAAVEAGTTRVVVVGTADEYGPIAAPFRESDREAPVTNYGVSKLAATKAALAIEAAGQLEVVVVRPGLAYGPGQPEDMFLGSLIAALREGRTFDMTEGRQTRDFIYVDDVARALTTVATAPGVSGRIFNVGSGEEVQIRRVAELVEGLIGEKGLLQLGKIPNRAGEAMRYALDTSAISRDLGFAPEVPLAEGLRRTLAPLAA
jgi:UDP-glucose 4-epimerase